MTCFLIEQSSLTNINMLCFVDEYLKKSIRELRGRDEHVSLHTM
jgi:hypothetical protein